MASQILPILKGNHKISSAAVAPSSPNYSAATNNKKKGWKWMHNVVNVLLKFKKLGQDDPRRIIHSFKVALSITLVATTFYYLNPLYHDFGSDAMWAIFTVIVLSEFSVGATLGKGLNRGLATIVAAALGLVSYHITRCAGNIGEPMLIGLFLFLLAAGVTYVRFFPQIKAKYDYGLLVFILTFCMVSLSSYRDEEILNMAKKRIITILIGAAISLLICVVVFPIWAGDDLHNLVSTNLGKLGFFLENFGDEYFKSDDDKVVSTKSSIQGYINVLNSKQAEENLANFAKWEPWHGRFKSEHPWELYLKIGSLSRQCAYRVDALNGFLHSAKTPPEMRSKLQEPCVNLSRETGKALKKLGEAISKMEAPSSAEPHIYKSKIGSMKLKHKLRTQLLSESWNILEAIPAVTVASLLLDVVSVTERLAISIRELSSKAKFTHKQKTPKHLHHESKQPLHHESKPPLHNESKPPLDHLITIHN